MSRLGEKQTSYQKQQNGTGDNSQNMVAKQFDDLAEDYDEDLQRLLSPYMVGTDTEKFAEYKAELVYNLLHTRPIQRILDFGCGTGRSIQYLRKCFGENLRYYGCDVSYESIQKAQEINQSVQYFQNDNTEKFIDYWKSPREGMILPSLPVYFIIFHLMSELTGCVRFWNV